MTAHIRSNGNHFLTAGSLVYWTYKVSETTFNWEPGYYRAVLLEVTMHSKVTAHIRSNGSHFLAAVVLVYWTYKVRKTAFKAESGYYRALLLEVTMYSELLHLYGQPEAIFWWLDSMCTKHIRFVQLPFIENYVTTGQCY